MTQIGTPYWTAPEVFNDDVYNEKVDVYSFAICLWEVWTRKTPWEGEHGSIAMHSIHI